MKKTIIPTITIITLPSSLPAPVARSYRETMPVLVSAVITEGVRLAGLISSIISRARPVRKDIESNPGIPAEAAHV